MYSTCGEVHCLEPRDGISNGATGSEIRAQSPHHGIFFGLRCDVAPRDGGVGLLHQPQMLTGMLAGVDKWVDGGWECGDVGLMYMTRLCWVRSSC